LSLIKFYSLGLIVKAWALKDAGATDWPALRSLWPSIPICIAICLFSDSIGDACQPFFYKIAKSKTDDKERVRRAHYAASNVFKIIYYIVVSIYGYIVVKDLPFTPW